MKICGMEKFSLVDYDGYVACTLFLAGCNFKCPFCHNGSLAYGGVNDQEIKIEEVLKYLDDRKGVVDAVVISGGEPTISKDLESLIMIIKARGLKVKLDSNGTNPDVIKSLLENNLLDFIAMDIKNGISKYDEITAVKVNKEKIIESIKLIMNSGIDYEFRTTLVKEFHSLEDMDEIGKMIKGAKKYCLQKFVDKENCISHNLHEVPEEEAKAYLERIKKYISNSMLRGY